MIMTTTTTTTTPSPTATATRKLHLKTIWKFLQLPFKKGLNPLNPLYPPSSPSPSHPPNPRFKDSRYYSVLEIVDVKPR